MHGWVVVIYIYLMRVSLRWFFGAVCFSCGSGLSLIVSLFVSEERRVKNGLELWDLAISGIDTSLSQLQMLHGEGCQRQEMMGWWCDVVIKLQTQQTMKFKATLINGLFKIRHCFKETTSLLRHVAQSVAVSVAESEKERSKSNADFMHWTNIT